MVDRIKQIMKHVQLTPAAFAERIGIGRSNLTHIFTGRNQPSLDIVKKILKAFPEIQPEWLIMGMGNMLRDNNDKIIKPEKVSFGDHNKLSPDHQTNLFDDMIEEPIVKDKSIISGTEVVKPSKKTVYKSKSFSMPPASNSTFVKPSDTNIQLTSKTVQMSDSFCDKKITKIIFFFADHNFEIYTPS